MFVVVVDTAGVAEIVRARTGAWLAVMEGTDDYGCVCAYTVPFDTCEEAYAHEGNDNFGVRYDPAYVWSAA